MPSPTPRLRLALSLAPFAALAVIAACSSSSQARTCTVNADCASGQCRAERPTCAGCVMSNPIVCGMGNQCGPLDSGDTVCLQDCTGGEPCAEGYECKEVSAQIEGEIAFKLCKPVSGVCE